MRGVFRDLAWKEETLWKKKKLRRPVEKHA
jgi:hypothetical protein